MVVTTLEFLGLAVARKCAWNQEEKAKCEDVAGQSETMVTEL
jgi:hypothetical protein